jgi:hypothetical protein
MYFSSRFYDDSAYIILSHFDPLTKPIMQRIYSEIGEYRSVKRMI